VRVLRNPVRDYAWGSPTAIPDLLGQEPTGEPHAELWIGAHPGSPSLVEVNGLTMGLDDYIARSPEDLLGRDAAQRYGQLPFLTKLLAAEKPLSLQVHPSRAQAEQGFTAEEAAGVALSAPTRNYKDRNHKPEMIVALTDFDALTGFRDPAETRALLSALSTILPENSSGRGVLADLLAALGRDDDTLEAAFEIALSGPHSPAAVRDLVAALEAMTPSQAAVLDAWATELETFSSLNAEYPGDPGVLVSLLVNRVRLAPGEALYLPAGNLHAYLKGFGVEIMATSDNVLRGGLTPKHVDVEELKKTLVFEHLPVPFCRPTVSSFRAGTSEVFAPPFDEFSVEKLTFTSDGVAPVQRFGPAVFLVTAGAAIIDGTELHQGESGFLAADAPEPTVAGTAGTVAFLITGARS
jgi:mannose-6-phosphate isomerase